MDFIKFLGTAGARIVVARQMRSSAGIWLCLDDTNIYIDPGPGALVKCFSSRPKLDPTMLDAIILSHKHLDHSGDVNAMIEAMTMGGHKKKGAVLAPYDAFNGDPVILKYVRKYADKIMVLKEKGKYKIGNVLLSTPIKHIHGSETYGLKFRSSKLALSYITDTKFFRALPKYYKSDVLVISVLREKPSELQHLCIEDVKTIIAEIKPKLTILTHFGRFMIMSKPWTIAEKLSKKLRTKIIAANDGMRIILNR